LTLRQLASKIVAMVKKRPVRFSDEVRTAIESCGMSRYRISRETGIDAAILCRFVHGQVGLSMASLDKLAPCIGLHVVGETPKKGG